jgi:uncharacterized protein YigA (DUF484 family)
MTTTPLADEIAAHADALARVPDSTVATVAAAMTMLAQRARRMEYRLNEIVANAQADAMMQRASGDVVIDLRAWRGLA